MYSNSLYTLLHLQRLGDNMMMNHSKTEQIGDLQLQYQDQGYCVLPTQLPTEILNQVDQAIDRWIDAYPIEDHHAVFEVTPQYQTHEEELFQSAEGIYGFLEKDAFSEEGKLSAPKNQVFNKIGHALHDLIPEIKTLAYHPLIQQCVQIVGWPQAALVQSMVIFKPPRIGAEVPWHQDATYLISTPQRVFGIWIALEDATIENGCLWMAPGQHRSPLREVYKVDWTNRKGFKHPLNDTPWPTLDEGVPVEVKAGSVVLFHDHMPHRSNPNQSRLSRKALTFHCYDPRTQWTKENWLHRNTLSPFLLNSES